LLSKLKELDKKLEDKFKAFKVFPVGYVNKFFFRAAAVFIFLMFVSVYVDNGYSFNSVYISCPDYKYQPCLNPVYVCPRVAEMAKTDPTFYYPGNITFFDGLKCNTVPKWVCDKVPCDKEYLQPGEHYGRNLPFNFLMGFSLFIILSAFALNHVYYLMYKKRK
jgi:hypothetical protein